MLITPDYQPGEAFTVQFVWKLPAEGFVRARFEAEVLSIDEKALRYFVRLRKFVGGWEESPTGEPLPREQASWAYWQRVQQIEGSRVNLAFEAADGRPLRLRLETLTGEHSFFSKYSEN